MHHHPLVEVAYMLHGVCSTIVHGDLEIWLSALLIASFPKPKMNSCFCTHGDNPQHTRKTHQEEFLSEFLEGVHFHRSWRSFLFKWSISSCKALVSSSWERWLPVRDWLLLVWVVYTLTSRSLLCSRLTKWSSC